MQQKPTSNKILALLLTVAMVLTMLPLTAAAEGGVCTHEHGADCSYVEGADCGHKHGEGCGEDCTHDCADGTCGYIEAVDCDHRHDEDCGGLSLGDSGKTKTPTGIIIAAFDELDDFTLYQGFDCGEIASQEEIDLPETLTGTDAQGNPVTIEGVTWKSATDFDPAVSIAFPGYIFTLTLPEGYAPADGVTAPVITVFIRPEGGVGITPLAATDSKIDIGGETDVPLDSGLQGDLASKGWSWDGTATLTLGSNYSGSNHITIYCGPSDNINLVLTGDVAINSMVLPAISVLGIDSFRTGGSLTVQSGSFTLNATSGSSGLQAHSGVFIESGTVLATGDDHGICSYYGDVTISGSANVTATATDTFGSNGIQAEGDVIINTSGTVVASGNTCGISAVGTAGIGGITITNGMVTAKGTSYGALAVGTNGVNITGGTVITGDFGGSNGDVGGNLSVSGAATDVTVNGSVTNGGSLMVSGGTVMVTGDVDGTTTVTGGTVSVDGTTIPPSGGAVTGTIDIGGDTDKDLAYNQSGTGWTWTASTATLTLTSAYVSTNPIAINCTYTDTINLEYTGDVSVTSAAASAIFCDGNLSITGSGGTLTLNSTSSNALYCAIEVLGALTIGGSANVSAACAGSGTNPAAAVIYAKYGMTISGSASVTTNATGTDASGIYVEFGDIAVSTSGTVTANGTGTGGALAIRNGQKLNMSSGNLALTGNPLAGWQFVDINISGGNITIGGTQVYKAVLTLSGVSAAIQVTAISAPASGYGISSEFTSADGKLCFLLPAGNQTVTLTAGGATYTGTFTVATNHMNTATLATGGGAGETISWPNPPGNGVLATVKGQANSLAPSCSASGKSASLSDNSVTVNNGGTVGGAVWGAVNSSDTDNVTGNRVFINSGGETEWGVFGGENSYFGTDSAATGNSVTISGGAVGTGIGGGTVYGGFSGGSAANNSVTISGGEVFAIDAGGFFSNGNVTGGGGFGATSNTVDISGSAVVGGTVSGGYSDFGDATGNKVTITGGAVRNSVVGGYGSSAATDNSVTISGGTVGHSNYPTGGNVWGGYSSSGDATGNTVTISGSPTILGTIYGGATTGSGDINTGNKLEMKTTNLTVAGVKNFEFINFYLPQTIANGATMLTSTAAADLTGVTVGLDFAAAAPSLAVGNTITLINGVTGTYSDSLSVSGYTFAISVSGGKLVATVTAVPGGASNYTATLIVNKDGSAWSGHGKTFTLKLSGNETTTQAMTGAGGTVTATVGDGTWKVYDGATDTGKTITISGAARSATLDYYTVQFAVTNAGSASGSTISAIYNGSPITNGDVLLGGVMNMVILTAMGSGATTYTYLWSDAGTYGETTSTVSISLTNAINATCTVTGTTPGVNVTGISVKTQPTTLTYTEGQTLNLTGLEANLTLSDGSNVDVTYANFGTYGIAVTYTGGGTAMQGDILTAAAHNGKTLTLTCNGFTAQTNALTVSAAVNTYTVTFNANGGTVNETMRIITQGAAIGTLPIPTRSGSYSFDGWYMAAGGGTGISAATVPTGNTTYYAHWTDTSGNVNNDGGGGGGGGTTTTPSSTITTEKKPDQPIMAKQDVAAKIDANGNATVTITEAMVKALIEKAKASGNTADSIGVQLNLTFDSAASSFSMQLDAAALALLVSMGVDRLDLNSPTINFSFDKAAISELKKKTTGAVTVSATPVTKLSDAAKNLIGSRPVFDIIVQDDTGKIITSYGDGKVTRGLKYTPAGGENTGGLGIVRIEGDQVQWLDDSSYSSGWVNWSGNSNSVYGVGYKKAEQGAEEELRLAGDNRIETAVTISQEGWPEKADAVVLVYAYSFPDALAAAPLAYKENAPILLTDSQSITSSTLTEIQRLNPAKVILVGGTAVLSVGIENTLRETYQVTRYAGTDRYETAAQIAETIGTTDRAVIVNGEVYQDALVISSYAANQGLPILFTERDSLPSVTSETLNRLGVVQTIVTGGTGVVSEAVYAQLPNPTRYAGYDSYETAALVAGELNLNLENVYIVTGTDFADALVAGNLAAHSLSPLLMAGEGSSLPPATETFFRTNKAGVKGITVVGGSAVVPESQIKAIRNILK